ncbi:hypothetical protein BASA83_009713 [Batrachochytrium salamandrivorans]|nr:hypothetical protein BASA83_009713 [Batrachochytrium salamandrivorans]
MLQPFPSQAKLSEKYSNNVDTTLASGLEARSYQPVLNSQKDLATLTSLNDETILKDWREEPSRSDPSPPFTSSLKEIDDSAVIERKFSSNNLASTIDKVGDDVLIVFNDGELAGKRIDGAVGDKVARSAHHLDSTFSSRWTLLWELKALLGRFEAGKTLEGYVADIIQSFGNFRTDQQSFYTEIIKELGFKFSLVTIPIHLNPSQSIPIHSDLE